METCTGYCSQRDLPILLILSVICTYDMPFSSDVYGCISSAVPRTQPQKSVATNVYTLMSKPAVSLASLHRSHFQYPLSLLPAMDLIERYSEPREWTSEEWKSAEDDGLPRTETYLALAVRRGGYTASCWKWRWPGSPTTNNTEIKLLHRLIVSGFSRWYPLHLVLAEVETL